ncbi:MAG: hypothetical protein LBM75_02485 [Myxococcales bacterium]|jgi:hypothetical protein|nr:hypothetical protein [Myxococcales bacterium]
MKMERRRRTRTQRFSGLVGLALLSLALAGCTQSPSKVAWDFHRALFLRDCARALQLLSTRTRGELERRARAASEASGGSLPDKPATMICQGDLSLYRSANLSGLDVVQVEPVALPEGASRAVVQVTIAGEQYPMDLTREAEGWRVDLDLARAPQLVPAGEAPTTP